jgi:hypothetical protein
VRERVPPSCRPWRRDLDGALFNSAAEASDEHATMNNWQMYGSCFRRGAVINTGSCAPEGRLVSIG